jgi:triacylglycerol esterase/lipase EstA (alpha/beta hydrolase family)
VSPARRLLVQGLVLLVGVALVSLLLVRLLADDAVPATPVAQDEPGPVLLVPGYGGSTTGLEVLAQRLRAAGRQASVVPVPGDGRGDLRGSAAALGQAADAAIEDGAPSVDVVGYSAGGVVARLWAEGGGASQARRIVTLGAPHHGTSLAALGVALAPGACPLACQQLAPDSLLLAELNEGDETPEGPEWLSLWTDQDTIVTPPESARLSGAVEVVVQRLCPGAQVNHGQLPRDPRVQAIVLRALSPMPLAAPAACPVAGPAVP